MSGRSIPLNLPVYLCKLFEFHFYLPTLWVCFFLLLWTIFFILFTWRCTIGASCYCHKSCSLSPSLSVYIYSCDCTNISSSTEWYTVQWFFPSPFRWVLVKPGCFYPVLSFISFYFHTVSIAIFSTFYNNVMYTHEMYKVHTHYIHTIFIAHTDTTWVRERGGMTQKTHKTKSKIMFSFYIV